MLTLYNAAHSTCSQKVRICLAEKDLPFEDTRPIRKQFYRRMGPKGFKREDVEASLEQLGKTCARMQARPAFQRTFYPGSRMSEFLPPAPAIKEESVEP